MIRRGSRPWFLIFVVGILVPTGVLLSVWWPVLAKYSIVSLHFSAPRNIHLGSDPADHVLEEIGRQSFAVPIRLDEPSVLRIAAAGVIRGELELPGYPRIVLRKPFALEDLERVPDTLGLHLGSLADVRILLDAYSIEPREEYLARAVERYVDFVRAERNAWLPHGFLWNDHAIAARISLSAALWRMARKHPRYESALGTELPIHIQRSIRLLASPAQYTYATNHGVMQNVALLQAAAAFPGVPETRVLAEVAIKRLSAQLDHYLGPEGMVLEHSAGYHKHGVELLTIAVRAAELAGLQIPDWRPRIAKARSVLEVIRRPDGSLPRFGNTFGYPESVHDFITLRVQAPRDGLLALPVSGFAFWRSSAPTSCKIDGTHLTLAASLFPGHGHKLADEGSLMLWSGGRSWFDNTGYWPYGAPGRSDVDGWRGSNAPHLVAEATGVARVPVLTHAIEENGLLFLAFSRVGVDGLRLHREVLGIDGVAWLVADFADNASGRPLETLWTFDPDLQVRTKKGPTRGYEVFDAGSPCLMDFLLADSDPVVSTGFRGNMSPFGGWMVKGGKPVPAEAIELASAVGRSAELFVLRSVEAPAAVLAHWQAESAVNWQARIRLPAQADIEILRSSKGISLVSGLSRREISLTELPPPASARAEIAASLQRLANLYPPQRDYLSWRIKVTYALLGVAAAALLILILVSWRFAKWLRIFCLADLVAWIMMGLWLRFVYFV